VTVSAYGDEFQGFGELGGLMDAGGARKQAAVAYYQRLEGQARAGDGKALDQLYAEVRRGQAFAVDAVKHLTVRSGDRPPVLSRTEAQLMLNDVAFEWEPAPAQPEGPERTQKAIAALKARLEKLRLETTDDATAKGLRGMLAGEIAELEQVITETGCGNARPGGNPKAKGEAGH
jgi:hypothetical protein